VIATVTLDEARQQAHATAIRNDAIVRRYWEQKMAAEFLERRTYRIDQGADCFPRHGLPELLNVRRCWCVDRLPRVRTLMLGPRWRQAFGVEQRPIAEINPPWAMQVRADRKWVLVFTLEDEVRERVLEEIRPGIFAQWSDPREWLGVA
jgi:hypothetical protein